MRVYSSKPSICFRKDIKNNINLMQPRHHHNHDYRDDHAPCWSWPIKCSYFFAFILVTLFVPHYIITVAADDAKVTGTFDGVIKGFKNRTRSPKIASIHILQAAPESLPTNQHDGEPVPITAKSNGDNQTNLPPTGKFEIRIISGEPNYKSVNLTWEVENVCTKHAALKNCSMEMEFPTSFQVFFCEIQSFGPHRCRSKVVNGTSSLQMYATVDNDLADTEQIKQVHQYTTQIDNLRLATKYSFHIRVMQKQRNMKITGRSELFSNEIEREEILNNNLEQGQTIIIPTKGFSAEATKCLPTASEIEVDTGPYFGGKIVVDGGNCGVKGDPNDIKDKYVIRIDHKTCGSMVKPETNTVETFITVQEKLGIFTHSTRRFVVVCSYQSGLHTVRASFSVPGRGGASAVQQDIYEEEERMARGLKPIRYVDKSALVLKETDTTENNAALEETEAMVKEMGNPAINYNNSDVDEMAADDTTNAVAILENIIPGLNEEHIKQAEVNENETHDEIDEQQENIQYSKGSSLSTTAINDNGNEDAVDETSDIDDAQEKFSAKFAKLILELNDRQQDKDEEDSDNYDATPSGRGFGSSVELITLNMGSVLLTVLLSVILIGIFIYVVYRERNSSTSMSSSKFSNRQHQHKHLHIVDNLGKNLRNQNSDTLA